MENPTFLKLTTEKVQAIHFAKPKEKRTTFSLSKRHIMRLNAKLRHYQCFSSYLEYLIDRYSYEVYRGYISHEKFVGSRHKNLDAERILLHCQVFQDTLRELNELALFASVTRVKMFRILFERDIGDYQPTVSLAI